MIDKITLSKEIELDTSLFSKKMYHRKSERINKKTGEIYCIDYYIYKTDSICLIYSNKTHKLKVIGRLINSNYVKNRIYNFDDYMKPRFEERIEEEIIEHTDNWLCENSYYNHDDELCFPECKETITHLDIIESHSIEEIIANIDCFVNQLIGSVDFQNPDRTKNKMVDIEFFNVDRVEICFNIWLQNGYVSEYIKLFNHIFKSKKDKRYKNFILEHKLNDDTSFYVKTRSAYNNNINNNYTVNFYNKLNQLKTLEKTHKVTETDKKIAKDCLRMEVQLYHRAIKKLCDENGITKAFMNFLDLNFCLDILKYYYERFIADSKLDFYSYKKAKNKVESTLMLTPGDKKNLLNHIQERYQYNKQHSQATRSKYNKMLYRLKIADVFIPTSYGVDYMKSPMRLLNQKLNHYQKWNKKHLKRTWKKISTDEFKSI